MFLYAIIVVEGNFFKAFGIGDFIEKNCNTNKEICILQF